MLTLGRAPVVGHVLSELSEAEIQRAVLVLSPTKGVIRDFVGDGTPWGLSVGYAVQETMRGVGDAILTGLEPSCTGSTLAAFGDCAILRRPGVGSPSPARRLIEAHMAAQAHATVLCEKVPRDRTRHYGVLKLAGAAEPGSGEPMLVEGIVEKPDPSVAPSCWAVAARWILEPEVIEVIRRLPPGPNGEVGVTEAIAQIIAAGGCVAATPLLPDERRCDVGNWRSLLTAQALAAVWDAEFGSAIIELLKTAPCGPTAGEV